MKATLKELYGLFKIRIGLAIALSAMAGLAVTPGVSLPAWQIAVLGLTALGASAAAGAFNQLVEVDLDARMARTRRRPFVTGRYKTGAGWHLGILLLLAGSVTVAGLVLNPLVGLYLFLGAVTYGVVYTVWLKPRTPWNIVIGGLSGTFAVLAGSAAIAPVPGPLPVIMAMVLFLWTPPHFWSLAAALEKDYASAHVPMLPVVLGIERGARVIFAHTVVLVAISLLPGLFGYGPVYMVPAALGGGYFLYRAWHFVKTPQPGMAMRAFFASLAQLILVLAGAMLEGGALVQW
ncbi:MAG: protoheme IX farnesyltransferase [Rhodospirillales bacterium]|nr:protoheme IX farnesyltransferase [Rhodospirillales bacterium]MBO6785545.1 protoheme IX farnesyltransferase [Rhodospirillales bacterium]